LQKKFTAIEKVEMRVKGDFPYKAHKGQSSKIFRFCIECPLCVLALKKLRTLYIRKYRMKYRTLILLILINTETLAEEISEEKKKGEDSAYIFSKITRLTEIEDEMKNLQKEHPKNEKEEKVFLCKSKKISVTKELINSGKIDDDKDTKEEMEKSKARWEEKKK